jgi:PIN domain nuclease of toxin-antitoxin system
MGYRFDTSAFYWAAAEPARLSAAAETAFTDRGRPHLLSAASAYELANTHRIGKPPMSRTGEYAQAASALGLTHVPVSDTEARSAALIDSLHRVLSDRMIAAPARAHGLTMISPDLEFAGLGAQRLW